LLCDSLGPNWEDNFFQIDHMPIGSGCIGQVYKWVLKNDAVNDKSLLSDGESDHLTVAVKVLHPNVTELVLRDVLLMSWIASWIDYMCPDVYWVSLRECVHEFGEVMKKQLDLRLEAHNMKILKECFATHDYVRIPTPIDSLVDKSILVETFELFVHNIVHCDMHPGNLLIHTGTDGLPVLVLLDCGVTTSLSHRDWNNFHELFIAIVKADVSKLRS
jgi:aarF domain-containing kinase